MEMEYRIPLSIVHDSQSEVLTLPTQECFVPQFCLSIYSNYQVLYCYRNKWPFYMFFYIYMYVCINALGSLGVINCRINFSNQILIETPLSGKLQKRNETGPVHQNVLLNALDGGNYTSKGSFCRRKYSRNSSEMCHLLLFLFWYK